MPQNSLSKSSVRLLPEEKIILKSNPHWLFLFIPIFESFIFLFIYLFLVCPFFQANDLDRSGAICPLVSLFLFLLLFLAIYLEWKFNRLCLTNLRLIKERGIIGKHFTAIGLDKIQDVTCKYGILGRLFGYGDLIIESAGTEGKLVFEGMPSPKKLKWMIEREASRFGPKSAL